MEAFLEGLDFWSWWILALLLFVLELAAPGIVFLWMALAAAVTGIIAWLLPDLGWQMAFVVFGLLSVVSIIVGRKVWRSSKVETEDPTLNRRADQYVGKTFTLDTALENGRGRLHVGDGSWLAKGPDLPAGAKVRVTAVDGSVLEVEAAE